MDCTCTPQLQCLSCRQRELAGEQDFIPIEFITARELISRIIGQPPIPTSYSLWTYDPAQTEMVQ